jgi:hypothetical protein
MFFTKLANNAERRSEFWGRYGHVATDRSILAVSNGLMTTTSIHNTKRHGPEDMDSGQRETVPCPF